MKYPWENIPEPLPDTEPFPGSEINVPADDHTGFASYIVFMDGHVRVRAFKDGVQLGTFSITSDGTDLGAEISLQNGANYKIVVVGHPVTTDPIMTPEELANYLLTI